VSYIFILGVRMTTALTEVLKKYSWCSSSSYLEPRRQMKPQKNADVSGNSGSRLTPCNVIIAGIGFPKPASEYPNGDEE